MSGLTGTIQAGCRVGLLSKAREIADDYYEDDRFTISLSNERMTGNGHAPAFTAEFTAQDTKCDTSLAAFAREVLALHVPHPLYPDTCLECGKANPEDGSGQQYPCPTRQAAFDAGLVVA